MKINQLQANAEDLHNLYEDSVLQGSRTPVRVSIIVVHKLQRTATETGLAEGESISESANEPLPSISNSKRSPVTMAFIPGPVPKKPNNFP